jgi:hypothetical protein
LFHIIIIIITFLNYLFKDKMKQLLAIVLIIIVLAFVVWLVMRHKREGFGHGGGGFHGHSGGFGRRGGFGRGYRGYGYDWINYYPYWNSYDDGVRSCITNSVMGCGNSKFCYDNAINMCT